MRVSERGKQMINLGSKGRIDPFVLGIIGFTILVVVGVLLVAFNTTPQNEMTTYESTQTERPKVKVEKTHVDLGDMKISDRKTEEISFENTGSKPLQISNVYTSCGCTSAQVVINGEESPIFSMHGNPSWMGEIAPGGKAVLRAIYEPAKHPVQGKTEKTIFFKTNDPENSTINIHLTARVN
jgi:hypothetical protein